MDTTKIKETQMAKTPEELTEDWKAGKLESGWYYIKNEKWNCIFPDNYFAPVKSWRFSKNECIDKILAPVPDYEEFESLRKTANGVKYVSDKCWEKTKALEGNVTMFKSLFRQYLEREKDIENLRALLKECIYILNEYKHCFDVKHHNMTANIIDKANEVLE